MKDNRVIGRMQKIANGSNYDKLSKMLSDACNEVLAELLKEKAKEIGFTYDQGVLDLVDMSPEFQRLNQKLSGVLDELDAIALGWAEDTLESGYGGDKND